MRRRAKRNGLVYIIPLVASLLVSSLARGGEAKFSGRNYLVGEGKVCLSWDKTSTGTVIRSKESGSLFGKGFYSRRYEGLIDCESSLVSSRSEEKGGDKIKEREVSIENSCVITTASYRKLKTYPRGEDEIKEKGIDSREYPNLYRQKNGAPFVFDQNSIFYFLENFNDLESLDGKSVLVWQIKKWKTYKLEVRKKGKKHYVYGKDKQKDGELEVIIGPSGIEEMTLDFDGWTPKVERED